jgi:hypothetical protein
MEVHAHSHTARKKWTHYFWEFIMLFLAVFCGFLAEYQLEHMIEKERRKEYVLSFYYDLHNNLATCSVIIDGNKKKIEPLNNMEACYDSVLKNWKAAGCLAGILKTSRGLAVAQFSDGTIEQLKNAGGFRLLIKEDRDSIIQYDAVIRSYKYSESIVMQQSLDNVKNSFKKLVNFKAQRFFDSASYATEIPFLFSGNKELLNELFNDLVRYKRAITFQSNQMIQLKEKTNRLVAYFNAKYHLD